VRELRPGDVLIIARKGDETGQTIGRSTIPFSDHEVLVAATHDTESVPASPGLGNTADRAIDLPDLASIEPEDADTFLTAAENAHVKSAFAYFPRLHFYGQSKAHMLRWERYGGSILVYRIRPRKTGLRMELYVPPFPFDPAALRHALQRMRDFNGGGQAGSSMCRRAMLRRLWGAALRLPSNGKSSSSTTQPSWR
jgi:hypothetical protein